ncbi:MAG TPA: hypothetical protein PLD05_05855 [Thermogutta sp.]|nr:hypothetical protein [Thermogutta sp.]
MSTRWRRTLIFVGISLTLMGIAWAPLAYAQRVRFPTASLTQDPGQSIYQQVPPAGGTGVSAPSAASGTTAPGYQSTITQPSGVPSYAPPAGVSGPPIQGYGTTAPGVTGSGPYPSPWDPIPTAPPPTGTAGSAVGGINYPPGQVPYYAPAGPTVPPAPGAVYQGTTPPPPTWDPYAVPGNPSPSVFPQGGIFPGVQGDSFYNTMIRFREATGFRFTWIGGSDLGVNDLELYSTFAFPFLTTSGPPLRVTPGFAFHWWDGPVSSGLPESADMPSVTYDAYLDAGWNPQVSPVLGGELNVRVGVYSDFKRVTSDSLRLQGAGFLTLALTPNWKLKGGVIYLDRVRLKMLPAGGAIWVDNPQNPTMELALVFPSPRFAMRLPQQTTADVWWYVRGDYGGGSWTIKRTSGANIGATEQVDYNDLRLATGLEFYRLRGLRGYAEVGLAFSRELVYEAGWTDKYKPDAAVFLSGGLAF